MGLVEYTARVRADGALLWLGTRRRDLVGPHFNQPLLASLRAGSVTFPAFPRT